MINREYQRRIMVTVKLWLLAVQLRFKCSSLRKPNKVVLIWLKAWQTLLVLHVINKTIYYSQIQVSVYQKSKIMIVKISDRRLVLSHLLRQRLNMCHPWNKQNRSFIYLSKTNENTSLIVVLCFLFAWFGSTP